MDRMYPVSSAKFQRYRRIAWPRFAEIGEGVFLIEKRSDTSSLEKALTSGVPSPCWLELNHNKTLFEFSMANTPVARWKENYILGEAAKRVWRIALDLRFPKRDFVLVLTNDLTLFSREVESVSERGETSHDEERTVGWEIIPTIRLWSAGSLDSKEFHDYYSVSENGKDRVFHRHDPEVGLRSIEETLSEMDDIFGESSLEEYKHNPNIL